MALLKKNTVDNDQLENVISSSKEKSTQTGKPIESLVDLLIELQIINAPKKKQEEAIIPDRNNISDSESMVMKLVAEEDLTETTPIISKGSENDPGNLVVVEEEVADSSSKDLNATSSLDESENTNGKRQSEDEIANNSCSIIPNTDVNKLENSVVKSEEKAEAVLLALLSALNIDIADHNKDKSAEVSESDIADSREKEKDEIGEIYSSELTEAKEKGENLEYSSADQISKYDINLKVEFEGESKENLARISNRTEKTENLSSKEISSAEVKEENVEELYEAYKRLQSALIGPDLEDLQGIVAGFEQKVIKIEHQIYNPQELINLLLPVISEILSQKVAESTESRESVAAAMVPIIDEIIQMKTQANREAMGKALASALPVAISEQLAEHPEEFAIAIAPGMAAAIDEQIKLDAPAMINALYPIIHEVIHSKREEDIEAISAAIAPLLPPAISEQIRNSPQEIAQAIGPEMAAAIREQIKLDRDAMIEALAPEMGKAIKAQIEIERDAMVDALYPVIGSTIAKYMADVVRSINEKIENTLSMEGINRKFRAKMQGISEGELIMKEAVPFAVRAVFLIHKQSGLVISEAQTTGDQKLEADMVAGMLTAIRSFVNDCIAQSGDVSEINAIDYGNSKIMLEVAGYCYLAVVTQGDTAQWFIYRMQQTLQTIVEIAGDPIKNYEGDPTVIPEKVNEILENLANLKRTEKKPSTPKGLLLLGSLAAGLMLLPLGYFQYWDKLERRIEQETTEALASAPELAVYRLSVHANNDKLLLFGKLPNQYLRQRAEQIVQKVAPDRQLSNQIIAVEVPPDPVLTAAEVKRVTVALNKIEGIAITSRYIAGKVTVEGTVGQAPDAEKITQAFKQIPGVKAITNTVQLQQLVLPTRIYFDAGKTELKAENKAKILEVKAFLSRYPETTLTIIGHSDTKGSSRQNQRLALLRAESVRQALVTEGINPKRLQAVATPNPPLGLDSSKPLWLSRCVRFQPVNPGFVRK